MVVHRWQAGNPIFREAAAHVARAEVCLPLVSVLRPAAQFLAAPFDRFVGVRGIVRIVLEAPGPRLRNACRLAFPRSSRIGTGGRGAALGRLRRIRVCICHGTPPKNFNGRHTSIAAPGGQRMDGGVGRQHPPTTTSPCGPPPGGTRTARRRPQWPARAHTMRRQRPETGRSAQSRRHVPHAATD